jgi:hypothetical protein
MKNNLIYVEMKKGTAVYTSKSQKYVWKWIVFNPSICKQPYILSIRHSSTTHIFLAVICTFIKYTHSRVNTFYMLSWSILYGINSVNDGLQCFFFFFVQTQFFQYVGSISSTRGLRSHLFTCRVDHFVWC